MPQAKPTPAGEIFKGPEDGWLGLPLPERLDAARKYRNLQRIDLARIFGVTPGAVTRWLYGMKIGEDQAKAKPIPADYGSMGRSLVRLNGSGAAWVAGMGNGGATRRRPLRKGLDTPRGGYMLWSATERRSLITAYRPSSSPARAARGTTGY